MSFRVLLLYCIYCQPCYCTIRRNFRAFLFLAIKRNHLKMFLNVFSSTYTNSNCRVEISIILLLKNNLTNICSKVIYEWFMNGFRNLWLVYTCNMKSSGKYKGWKEGECTLHRWPKSREICGCTRPF